MYTYTVKQGDIARFPNGVEVSYDSITESLVLATGTLRLALVDEDSEGYVILRFVKR